MLFLNSRGLQLEQAKIRSERFVWYLNLTTSCTIGAKINFRSGNLKTRQQENENGYNRYKGARQASILSILFFYFCTASQRVAWYRAMCGCNVCISVLRFIFAVVCGCWRRWISQHRLSTFALGVVRRTWRANARYVKEMNCYIFSTSLAKKAKHENEELLSSKVVRDLLLLSQVSEAKLWRKISPIHFSLVFTASFHWIQSSV